MTRWAGSRGTGSACMVAGVQIDVSLTAPSNSIPAVQG